MNFIELEKRPGEPFSGPKRYYPDQFPMEARVRIYLPGVRVIIREGVVINPDVEKIHFVTGYRQPALSLLVNRQGFLERREPRTKCVKNYDGYWVRGKPDIVDTEHPYKRSYFYSNISLAEIFIPDSLLSCQSNCPD